MSVVGTILRALVLCLAIITVRCDNAPVVAWVRNADNVQVKALTTDASAPELVNSLFLSSSSPQVAVLYVLEELCMEDLQELPSSLANVRSALGKHSKLVSRMESSGSGASVAVEISNELAKKVVRSDKWITVSSADGEAGVSRAVQGLSASSKSVIVVQLDDAEGSVAERLAELDTMMKALENGLSTSGVALSSASLLTAHACHAPTVTTLFGRGGMGSSVHMRQVRSSEVSSFGDGVEDIDCAALGYYCFFTPGIIMGLMVVFVMLFFLLIGVCGLMTMQSPTRFEDPRKKPVVLYNE